MRKQQARYDVRYLVDDRLFRFGFDQRGWAESFAQQLQADFALGLLFDPQRRRFIPPPSAEEEADAPGPSFFSHAREYISHQWYRWAPGTRPNAQRELSRACIHLVRDDAPELQPHERLAADGYLRQVALAALSPSEMTAEHRAWEAWFERWSLPLTEITDEHLRRFLHLVRTETLDGTRREVSKSSINRTRMIVRRAFTHARRRRLIDWDPWEPIEPEPDRDSDQVDADLVMDPSQVRTLARACAQVNPRYEAFVLVQGLCGLRPGEALDLRRRDLELEGPRPTVTVRGTYSAVGSQFFTGEETRRRPLKGRGQRASRTIPLPSQLVPLLRRHLAEFVEDRREALVFTNTAGGRISLSNFGRDVWGKAREAVFAEDDPLRHVRRHDLRHSAITAWLNAGVPLKTAQMWSGHKTASVLLNTYLGVLRGDEDLAHERWQTALDSNDRPEDLAGS